MMKNNETCFIVANDVLDYVDYITHCLDVVIDTQFCKTDLDSFTVMKVVCEDPFGVETVNDIFEFLGTKFNIKPFLESGDERRLEPIRSASKLLRQAVDDILKESLIISTKKWDLVGLCPKCYDRKKRYLDKETFLKTTNEETLKEFETLLAREENLIHRRNKLSDIVEYLEFIIKEEESNDPN